MQTGRPAWQVLLQLFLAWLLAFGAVLLTRRFRKRHVPTVGESAVLAIAWVQWAIMIGLALLVITIGTVLTLDWLFGWSTVLSWLGMSP